MKRFVESIIISAALAFPIAGGAQTLPVRAPSLAPLNAGEIMLTVRGKGMQITTPDFASLTVLMMSSGADNASAVAANRKLIDQTNKTVIAAGVEAGAIQMQSSDGVARMGFVGAEQFGEGMDGAATAQAQPAPYSASSSMVIRFTDMAKLAKVRAALLTMTGVQLSQNIYGLNDDSSARRSAIDQALAKARADAAIYAKTMNMRIDRTVRIADGNFQFDVEDFTMLAERGRTQRDGVQTTARVEIDMVLKPL